MKPLTLTCTKKRLGSKSLLVGFKLSSMSTVFSPEKVISLSCQKVSIDVFLILEYNNMHLFGLTFLRYFLKLSLGNEFYNKLWNTDYKVYKEVINVERLLLKLKKYECNLLFLVKCKA